jgi:hypothetical protein
MQGASTLSIMRDFQIISLENKLQRNNLGTSYVCDILHLIDSCVLSIIFLFSFQCGRYIQLYIKPVTPNVRTSQNFMNVRLSMLIRQVNTGYFINRTECDKDDHLRTMHY